MPSWASVAAIAGDLRRMQVGQPPPTELLRPLPPPIFVEMSENSKKRRSTVSREAADLRAEIKDSLPHPYITYQGLSAEPNAAESRSEAENNETESPASPCG